MLKELKQLIKACDKPFVIKLSVKDMLILNAEIKESAQNVEFNPQEPLANTVKFEVLTDAELAELQKTSEERPAGRYLTV